MLDKSGQTPLYIQLRNLIQKRIEDGVYSEGTAIPSERELCRLYGVSRITVRQAIDLAVNEGLLVRRQGKGTYVETKRIIQALEHITSFDRTMTGFGMFPKTFVLDCKDVIPTDKICSALGVGTGVPVTKLVLLGTADSEPLAVYVSYFIPELGSQMAKRATQRRFENKPFTSFDLYDELNEEFRPAKVKQTFEARFAPAKAAKYLELERPAVVLVVESVVEARANRPLEYRTVFYRAERYKFSITRDII